MKDNRDPLLIRYESLIVMSLLAQERDDVEQEDRAVDGLDVVWAEMSGAQRRYAEDINKRAIAWVTAKAKTKGVSRFVEAKQVFQTSQSSGMRVHLISGSVGRNDRAPQVMAGSELSSVASRVYSQTGLSSLSSQCSLAG